MHTLECFLLKCKLLMMLLLLTTNKWVAFCAKLQCVPNFQHHFLVTAIFKIVSFLIQWIPIEAKKHTKMTRVYIVQSGERPKCTQSKECIVQSVQTYILDLFLFGFELNSHYQPYFGTHFKANPSHAFFHSLGDRVTHVFRLLEQDETKSIHLSAVAWGVIKSFWY